MVTYMKLYLVVFKLADTFEGAAEFVDDCLC